VTDNDILVKVLYFSVDPVMKVFLAGAKTYFNKVIPGDICNCFGLGKIIQGN
jgi:NADPH-dependent curcumin reductase CurA